MKNKVVWYILGAEAIICILLSIFGGSDQYSFINVLKFPFEQIAFILRNLSLSGFAGNIIAILIYILICSLPIFAYMSRRKKKMAGHEDLLLILLSISLFAGIYLMINPVYISNSLVFISEMNFGFIAIGSTIYSIMIGYTVLRIMKHASDTEAFNLIQGLKVLLFLLSSLLIFNLSGTNIAWLVSSFEKVASGNTEMNAELHMTNFFIVIQYIFKSVPAVLELWIIYHCNKLLSEFRTDRFSDQSIDQTKHIVKITRKSILVIVMIYVIQNLSQLIFSKMLLDMNYAVNIPLDSLIFIFVILLASKYLSETSEIKKDNDMFI